MLVSQKKALKDADFCLVFFKKKQRNCPLNLFSDCNVIQNSFGPHPLMTSLQKKFKPKNTQMFFNLSHLLSVDFEFEVLPSWYVCYSDR